MSEGGESVHHGHMVSLGLLLQKQEQNDKTEGGRRVQRFGCDILGHLSVSLMTPNLANIYLLNFALRKHKDLWRL